jgi:hypothetical protein
MREQLLNLLREIADPNCCKLPEGWDIDTDHLDGGYLDYFTPGMAYELEASTETIMDLLGRLMRAIEG